jgi:UDP-N-acetylmuramoyl-L-alanyl-D-glutamate--2,6-diaminopimelate ligase
MAAQLLKAHGRSLVMEVSSHALDQERVWGVAFDAAIFTNLSRDHLDYHGTLDRYFAAKARLFEGLRDNGKKAVAVINGDDPRGPGLVEIARAGAAVVTFGLQPSAMVHADEIRLAPGSSACRVNTPWGSFHLVLNLPGRFNISNALAAAACAGALGIKPARMAGALNALSPVPGRLEPVLNRRGIHVFVDYAHTDDALANVLGALAEFKAGRLLVVFGCGGDRDRTKRPLMGAAAARLADYTILTSDNPRTEDPERIIDEIATAFSGKPDRMERVTDRREAIQRALRMARENDTVLIAGKGHETYQEFSGTVVPFNDHEVARDFLQ